MQIRIMKRSVQPCQQLGRELELCKEDRLRMMADRDELETHRDKLFQEIYLFVIKSLEVANKRHRDPARGMPPVSSAHDTILVPTTYM